MTKKSSTTKKLSKKSKNESKNDVQKKIPSKKVKAQIIEVKAREILDSRGNPTVEAEVYLADGSKAWAQVPSGASTGSGEALELRDGDPHRFHGKGVLYAVKNINVEIANLVIGMDATNQKAIDDAMIHLDGSENKSRLGANAILAVSLAVCRAASVSKKLPLYKYIASICYAKNKCTLPIPMFNIINGGAHADSGLAIQEYKLIPNGIKSFKEQYRTGSEIFHSLKKLLADGGMVTAVGDEGGFAPRLENNEEPLAEIAHAAQMAGYEMGKDVNIGIDAAANFFYKEKCGHYAFELEKQAMTEQELLEVYDVWITNKHLISIEDGLREDDWDGWSRMHKKLGTKAMIIGDDLLVTNEKRLKKAIEKKACNAVLIKPNQIGTLSETLACMQLAKRNNIKTIVSHRSGETIDDFIADLSVGTQADYIKTGSLSRGERLAKYNRLLAIEEQLKTKK